MTPEVLNILGGLALIATIINIIATIRAIAVEKEARRQIDEMEALVVRLGAEIQRQNRIINEAAKEGLELYLHDEFGEGSGEE